MLCKPTFGNFCIVSLLHCIWSYENTMGIHASFFALLATFAAITGVDCQYGSAALNAAAGAALHTAGAATGIVSKGLSTVIIVVIVIAVLIVLAVIGCIICCVVSCSKGKRSGRVIAPVNTQPQVTVATTTVPPGNTGMAPVPHHTH
ncbi:uncharacterized protein LOC124137519 [Haliotis rufescens]|uniref:uncharacterized protein LOC124137519 n=1 Tax=Haliotis rufescens TaxID=6454 RepID=UPI001EB01004|nr:uncharacterized protein LOC124137519 [Haliotis rufescens]